MQFLNIVQFFLTLFAILYFKPLIISMGFHTKVGKITKCAL